VESATTELTRLPGLEVAETKAEVKPEHWIERGPSKRLMLFSGRSHPALAQKIAEKLGIQVGDVTLRTFADGNTYCRYEESIRGSDLFIVQTSSPPVDQHLMELMIMIDAAKLASAKRITAVLPLYPYSRQDKKSRPREGITAKLVAEMIQTAGADRVLTMDLHAGQIQGFFDVPVDHMTALPMLAQYVRDLGLAEDVVAVAPDTGRTRLASKFAEMIGGDLAVLQKDRPAHNVARVTNVIGDIDGKCAVMTDDMRTRQRHRHRHGADRPADEAGARDRPDRGRHPRRDDPQRLRRRLGVRHLPGHERPLLTRGLQNRQGG
jgi:ribose-phosphate pyrophosphokinase